MRQNDLYVLILKVDRLVQRCLGHILPHKVKKTVVRLVGSSVEDQGETFFEVRIVLHHGLDIVHVELETSEHLVVRGEYHKSSVLLADLFLLTTVLQLATLVAGP